MSKEITLKDSSNNNVLASISIPNNTKHIVIISHGFQSSKENKFCILLEKELNKLNIGTIRYDQYGNGRLYKTDDNFGLSPDITLTKTLESLQAVIDYVLNLNKDYEISLFGSSYGGLLSIFGAIKNNDKIKYLALKSPVIEPLEFWNNRLSNGIIENWKKEGKIHFEVPGENYILNYTFYEDLQQFTVMDQVNKISAKVKLIHGEKDSIVPIKKSYELAQRLGIEVNIIKGADHGYKREIEFEKMKSLIINFFKTNLK